MALTDKNIVITPNIGATDDPKIVFSGADASTAAQNITLYTYPTSNGTVSFEGSAGQLFSITNDLTGTIFSVNDVSGIPSIEVNADGTINLAEFGGNVFIGEVLAVAGPQVITANTTAVSGSFLTVKTAGITITLPASPAVGSFVIVKDGTGNAASSPFTVARNGQNIAASATNLTFDKNYAEITMTYVDATIGWSV